MLLVFDLSVIAVPNLLRLVLSFGGMHGKLVMLYGVYGSVKIDIQVLPGCFLLC